MVTLLTDFELSKSSFPLLPIRLSQRRSTAITRAIAPRSYESLREWPMFFEDAAAMGSTLDNVIQRNLNPMTSIEPLDEAADEIEVRVPLEGHIFPQTNKLASRLGLQFKYKQGGSGRSFSFTDLVILDSSQGQPTGDRKQLSSRVYGNGEVKGSWQCSLAGFSTLILAMGDTTIGPRVTKVIQQLFGDMILDESKYGFISDYNYTVFFRRVAGTKILEYSPIVKVESAPVEKFLFVISRAEVDKAQKANFLRVEVKETPPGGYRITLPQQSVVTRSGRSSKRPLQVIQVGADRPSSSKRPVAEQTQTKDSSNLNPNHQRIYEEDEFGELATYDMEALGITGSVIGMAKHGNVIEGHASNGRKLALKLFDLRKEEAAIALVREQKAYHRLKSLQGSCIPRMLAVGRLAHTNVVFLALTDEADVDVIQLLQREDHRKTSQKIIKCLSRIHAFGVLQNDVKLSHILWNKGSPKFIDFDVSMVGTISDEEKTSEMAVLINLLARVSGSVLR